MRDTSEKILQAACLLMEEKGYQQVSVKEIAAQAKVSEMTVFRHFQTKLGVFEAMVEKYSYLPSFEALFEDQMVWDLETDLMHIAKAYLTLMTKNQSIFLIATQERTHFPALNQAIAKQTLRLKELITAYFQKMKEQGEIKNCDGEGQAIVFLTTLYGYFSSTALWEDHFLHDWEGAFLKNTVSMFSQALTI